MKQLAVMLLLSVITLQEYQCLQLDNKVNTDSKQKSTESVAEKQELKEMNLNQQKIEIKEKTQEKQQVKTDEKQKIESKTQVKSEAKVEQKVAAKSAAKVEAKVETKQKVVAAAKAQTKTDSTIKQKVEEKIQTKSKSTIKNKSKLNTKNKSKNKGKQSTDSDKTLSERAQEEQGDGLADDHVSKSELAVAAEQIAATEDEDIMSEAGLDNDDDEEAPKKESKKEVKVAKTQKKQSLVQSSGKAKGDAKAKKAEKEDAAEEKEDKKEEGKKDGKKSGPVNEYANNRENQYDWNTANEDLGFEDNASDAAKGHKVYKNMIKRFLPEKAKRMIEETDEEEDAKANDWANDKKSDKGEKEGLIPGDHDIIEAKYSNDYDFYRYQNAYGFNDFNNFDYNSNNQYGASQNGTKGAKGSKDAKKGKGKKADAKEAAKEEKKDDVPAELDAGATQTMSDLKEDEENESTDLDASTNLQLKSKNTKSHATKRDKKAAHKKGESYVSKHSDNEPKDDGIWDDMAEIFTNNKDFQKQTNKDSAEIDTLMGNKKSKKPKHDKSNILVEKDNVNTEKPAEEDSETKEDKETAKPEKKAKKEEKEDKPEKKAKKETKDDDEEEKPAKKEKKEQKVKEAPKADDPEEDPEEIKKNDLKKDAKKKELDEDDAENEDDELKKLNKARDQEKKKDDEDSKKKQEAADEKKAAKQKYLAARDESVRLQNVYKDLEEKTKAAKEAAEKQKKLAKKLHGKLGGGSEVEAELADEELGIDTEKEEAKEESPAAEEKPAKKSSGGASKGSGASVVQFTMKGKDQAESLVSKMFKNLLVADSQIQENNFERLYMNYKKETEENDVVKVRVITSDDRVPGLIRFVQKNSLSDESQEMSDDIIATRLVGGSKEYINWVKEQTKHKTESSDFSETGPIVGGDQELLSTIDDEEDQL